MILRVVLSLYWCRMRLAGNKKGKGVLQGQWQRQCEGGRWRRGQGQQDNGNGDGNKDGGQVECNGNKEVDGDGHKGGGQAMATAMRRAMVTARRMAGDKKAITMAANGDKGGGQAKVTRAMVTATAMATVTAAVQLQRRRWWRWWRQWQRWWQRQQWQPRLQRQQGWGWGQRRRWQWWWQRQRQWQRQQRWQPQRWWQWQWQWQWQQGQWHWWCGQWWWQQDWQAMKRARARAERAMMTAMRVVGKEEGKGGMVTRVACEPMAT